MGEIFQVPETDNISALEYEVIFAIAKDNLEEGERPDIPFFSKVSFRSVSSRLKHYGFKVSIKGINRTYRDNNIEIIIMMKEEMKNENRNINITSPY